MSPKKRLIRLFLPGQLLTCFKHRAMQDFGASWASKWTFLAHWLQENALWATNQALSEPIVHY
jgi:hypothetical protein